MADDKQLSTFTRKVTLKTRILTGQLMKKLSYIGMIIIHIWLQSKYVGDHTLRATVSENFKSLIITNQDLVHYEMESTFEHQMISL